MRGAPFLLACCLALSGLARADDPGVAILPHRPAAATNALAPIVYWSETRTAPRPLRIHCLQIDLRSRQHEVVAVIGHDPDGDGPAESRLEKPLPWATSNAVLAAVNSNAFAPVPPLQEGERPRWTERLPVDILGWARSDGRQASPPQRGFLSFWIGPEGLGHIGNLTTAVPARTAAAGFGELVVAGQPGVSRDKPVHPRTALGLDREGTTLWLVVVDGRQPGYSEGVTLDELAPLMKEIGCWNAVNLDGGGSSIMLLAKDGRTLSIMNRPSDRDARPVPVMVGVRRVR